MGTFQPAGDPALGTFILLPSVNLSLEPPMLPKHLLVVRQFVPTVIV